MNNECCYKNEEISIFITKYVEFLNGSYSIEMYYDLYINRVPYSKLEEINNYSNFELLVYYKKIKNNTNSISLMDEMFVKFKLGLF
jgi:hypothetical protein